MVETATLTGYTVSSSTCANLDSTPTLQGHNSPDNKHTRWTLRPLSHFVFPEQPTVLPFLPPNYMPFARPLESFPDSSAGKESACNAGDLGSIPGLGRALEKGKATHSRILAWRTPWTIQSYSSYSTHSWVLFTHFPSFKNHAHTDDTQIHVSSSSLSTELLTWIFYRNLNSNTPTMELSASPYAHTMEIRASI